MSRDKNINLLKELKCRSGNHSPSRDAIIAAIGYDPVKYDFCFLSNPYATELIIPRYKEAIEGGRIFKLLESYPASSEVVAGRIADFEHTDPGNIIVGNGAIQCIEWICTGWDIQNLLIPVPTFSTYYEFLGDRVTFWSEDITQPRSAEAILKAAQDTQNDAILLIHPNNPTGGALSTTELRWLVENLNGKKLIIDESFAHFLSDYQGYQALRNSISSTNVVFVKSMSKDFGIAGVRLGYMTTTDSILKSFASQRTTWNLNNFAVLFSEFLMDDDFRIAYKEARFKYLCARTQFHADLQIIDKLKVYDSEGNFFLIELSPECSENIVYEMLIDSGVYVRTMEDKIGLTKDFIRVACRTPSENRLFLDTIGKYI